MYNRGARRANVGRPLFRGIAGRYRPGRQPMRTRSLAIAGVVAVLATLGAAPEPAGRPVPRAHAHNDYAHPHPLFDALHHGFVGVEADVFLVGRELRISHDKAKDWTTVPTLEAAYLKPLSELKAKRNSGGIYADGTRLLLLIDIKTEDVPTYRRLHEVLGEFQSANPGLFTEYEKTAARKYRVTRGAVDVLITGNRPREVMARQDHRYAAYDGRVADIGPDVRPDDAPEFIPLISDNWEKVFVNELAWNGTGDIPAATRAKLEAMVADVHREGKLLRFWKIPEDAPPVWAALLDAGVDLINTDDLPGLARYLRSRESGRR